MGQTPTTLPRPPEAMSVLRQLPGVYTVLNNRVNDHAAVAQTKTTDYSTCEGNDTDVPQTPKTGGSEGT